MVISAVKLPISGVALLASRRSSNANHRSTRVLARPIRCGVVMLDIAPEQPVTRIPAEVWAQSARVRLRGTCWSGMMLVGRRPLLQISEHTRGDIERLSNRVMTRHQFLYQSL